MLKVEEEHYEASGGVVEARDLWKVYRLGLTKLVALRGVNLSVRVGEVVAIVGPSGSGKTTLLTILGTLSKPTRGVVLIGGVDVTKLSDEELAKLRNRKIGFVFQTFNLIGRLTALENVELPLIAAGVPPRARRHMALEALKLVGLEKWVNHRPMELSGGQQQRVAIARAIVTRPQIVLADEPTGNLDSKTALSIMELFKKLNEELGVTIIMVTHNLELTRYCHRVVHLRDGMIVKEELLREGLE
ncbi:MAG: ABC transporter ATP-binding protein [Thermoprotei archaeon]|nr:MAG: ABC transporter ATP-binding protein [Thermoprotei archaeon]